MAWCFGEEGEDSFSGKLALEAVDDSYKIQIGNIGYYLSYNSFFFNPKDTLSLYTLTHYKNMYFF